MLCTNTNAVWKHFHDNPLTHSEAHYLMTIHETQNARASDLVKALRVSAPSVSQALKTLIKKGWITQHPDKQVSLTSNAEAVVEQILKNKAMMMDFFVNFLGVDKEVADADSCKIEHLISPETGQALEDWLHKMRNGKVNKGSLPIIK